MTSEREHDSIRDFFNGKNIFITGGSGFIGKVLIEKLLRTCPNIGKLYILLRPKKGKTNYERVEQILASPVFNVLKSKFPGNVKKIIPINGDVCKVGLGISEDDRKLLRADINIFFNAAASVKFDDLIKDAIISNLRSAREAALLALEMKNIEAFLHVSTSYCNIDNRKVLKEILYPAPQSWREAIEIAENCDSDILSISSPKYIEGFPNTYTFTKRLAEHCINDLLVGKIHTIISRPSVVIPPLEEPFQGWIDNFNGPIGLLIAANAGILRIIYADPDINTDYTPVDSVVKHIIVSVWHKVNKSGKLKELSIHHITKNNLVEFKQSELLKAGKKVYWDIPFENKIWYSRVKFTTCRYEYYINVILFHVIPALVIDMLLKTAGYPAMLFKAQKKIYIANMALYYFITNEWKFDNESHEILAAALPAKEKRYFRFKIILLTEGCIYSYFCQTANCVRIHMLKENKEITEANITRTRRMYYLDMAIRYAFFLLVLWLFFVRVNVPKKLWGILYDYWVSL